MKSSCSLAATDGSSAATTVAHGMPNPTSSAWFGPERTATGRPGRIAWMTWLMRRSVPISSPFVKLTIIWRLCRRPAKAEAIVRIVCAGTARATTSFSAAAATISSEAVMLSESSISLRYRGFRCAEFTASTKKGSRPHKTTSWPPPASRLETAVPQLPAPITATAVMTIFPPPGRTLVPRLPPAA